MTTKFHEKNVAIFAEVQVSEGTPATIVAADAIAVTEVTGGETRTTEAFQYLGDSLDRSEITTVKDTFANVTLKTMMPTLGTLNPSLTEDNVPLSKLWRSCGGDLAVNGTTGEVTITNSIVADELLTLEYRKSSPEATGGDQKVFVFSDCRGSVDISLEAGSRTTVTFNYLGNSATPTMETAITPNIGNQIINAAAVVELANMQTATIEEITDLTGPTYGAPQTFCVNTFNAPNFFGFEYERYKLTCQEGYTKGATPTDVTAVILEDEVGGTDFDPDANVTKYFRVTLKWGLGAGKFVTLQMNQLQLANVAEAKISKYFGRELSLRNTGTSTIILN